MLDQVVAHLGGEIQDWEKKQLSENIKLRFMRLQTGKWTKQIHLSRLELAFQKHQAYLQFCGTLQPDDIELSGEDKNIFQSSSKILRS